MGSSGNKVTDTKQTETEVAEDDGIGGDEPFCQHGNLLWSEDCDECITESWKLSDRIAAAAIRNGE